MSTPSPQHALDLGPQFHLCIFPDCPDGSEAAAWHQQKILGYIHLIKQATTHKKYADALQHAHQLGAHRAYAPDDLIVRIEEAVALIPAQYLDDAASDVDTSYEGT